MSTEAPPNLEPRIANLEGTITQIDKRLTSLGTRVEAGFTDIRNEIRALRTLMLTLSVGLFGTSGLLITIYEFIN